LVSLFRFKGRIGPDFSLAPAEQSAITRAIRTAVQRKDEAIFLPFEGMTFNSGEEARDFYNLYYWERGFGVRFGRDRKNDGMYRTRQDLICSYEVCHCVRNPIFVSLIGGGGELGNLKR
jgi:hypothetical protein